MYGIKDAPKGSPEATIKINATDNALEEIRHRANVMEMSVDEFVRYAGYINPAMLSIQYLQKIGDPSEMYITRDLDLIPDIKLKKQCYEYFDNYKDFIGQKYSNAFFDCTTSGRYTSDKFLIGDKHTLIIKTTRWDKDNLKSFSGLFRVSLSKYLLFATTYETQYIHPLDLKGGISYLNEMLEAAKLINENELRKKAKTDILHLINYLNYLCENSRRFYKGYL